MSAPPVILLVAPPGAALPDLDAPLANAGFTPRRFGGQPPLVPAAVVILADAVDDPVAFTRRLRAGEPAVPIVWLLSRDSASLAPTGLDAGADVCLLRPANGPLLVAQLRALLRARTVTATADELRELTGRLQRLYEQAEQDAGLVERLAALAPRAIPAADHWRFGTVGSGCDFARDGQDRTAILLDVAGLGAAGGAATASALARLLARETVRALPAEVMTVANAAVRAIRLPDTAVLSACLAEFPGAGDRVRVASAGFPAPVLVRPDAPAEVWLGSGPFLGTTDGEYGEMVADLAPGDKLVLLGRGAADRRPDVRAIADGHRHLAAQPLAALLAEELGVPELTLVVAERTGS